MNAKMKASLKDLEELGYGKLASKLRRMLPRTKGTLSSRLLAVSTIRDAIEVAALAVQGAAPARADTFDLVRIDLLEALDAETYLVIKSEG